MWKSIGKFETAYNEWCFYLWRNDEQQSNSAPRAHRGGEESKPEIATVITGFDSGLMYVRLVGRQSGTERYFCPTASVLPSQYLLFDCFGFTQSVPSVRLLRFYPVSTFPPVKSTRCLFRRVRGWSGRSLGNLQTKNCSFGCHETVDGRGLFTCILVYKQILWDKMVPFNLHMGF